MFMCVVQGHVYVCLGEKLMFQSVMLKLENLHEDWEPWKQNNFFLITYKEMGLLRKLIK